MDLTPYVTALRDDLAAAASVGDEQTARAGTALAGALEPAVRLALMNALSDLASEISDSLDDHSVSLRLRGREVEVAVERTATAPTDEGAFYAGPASSPFAGAGAFRPGAGFGPPGRPGPGPGDMGDISRMTLRLVDQIKGQAEQAAASSGMSLNSWISQAVQGALRENLRGGRRHWEQGGWDHRGWGHDGGPGTGHDGEPGTSRDGGHDTGRDGGHDGGRDDGGTGTDRSSGDDGEGGSGVSGWVRG